MIDLAGKYQTRNGQFLVRRLRQFTGSDVIYGDLVDSSGVVHNPNAVWDINGKWVHQDMTTIHKFDLVEVLEKVNVYAPATAKVLKKCDCGGEAVGSPHYGWCGTLR